MSTVYNVFQESPWDSERTAGVVSGDAGAEVSLQSGRKRVSLVSMLRKNKEKQQQ